jgi:hypothetical protein
MITVTADPRELDKVGVALPLAIEYTGNFNGRRLAGGIANTLSQ